MLRLSNEDFKAAMINMFDEEKLNVLEINRKIEILRREIETKKRKKTICNKISVIP